MGNECCVERPKEKDEPRSAVARDEKKRGKEEKAKNKAEVLAKKVQQSKATGVLALRECGLKTLPEGAQDDDMGKVRTVDLSVNTLKTLPDGISSWTGLQNLMCAENQLSELPAAIGSLGKLQKLDLSKNRLTELPPQLAELGKLSTLLLDANALGPRLTSTDAFSGALATVLQELDLSGNAMQELPPTIGALSALTRLVIKSNKIAVLPDALGSCSKLAHLDAEDNLLTAVPSCVFQQTSLAELCLRGNPMDRLKLQETPGFEMFLERRKKKIDAKIDSHVVCKTDLRVCGLD
eukprot:gnl/TRDRNA2_/TRDRNA2_165140_c1_seq2.p1 gnl/TRDRNA2_/TRDRNA2_165140_c1~~gnl/TRDRNA2_/TRDRNA2_165140_c1_seq2.p1  ORF type:complete len:294 (-),score=64.55 gnl/TRDRNA2_/TRDRNA2_165140_c1_seq2:52-933(-)